MVKTHDRYDFKCWCGSERKDQIMSDLFSSNLKFITNSGNYYSSQQTISVFRTLYAFTLITFYGPQIYLCIAITSDENVPHYSNL